MIWLIQDFDLLSVLLRALTLSFEALTAGGVLFLFFAARPSVIEDDARRRVMRLLRWSALALALTQIAVAAESAVMLMGNGGLSFRAAMTARFMLADVAIAAAALMVFFLARLDSRVARGLLLWLALAVVTASVMLSHAASHLEHPVLLFVLTAAHHAGTAAWIGAMPYLLVSLRRRQEIQKIRTLARRYSAMALTGAGVLIAAGIAMSVVYVGSWRGLYGTSYGLMLLAKIYLLLLVLAMGAGNYFLLRGSESVVARLLLRLRRFSEVEIGIGFTIILIGASLTSQPPAADMTANTLTKHEITERMSWKMPSLTTPSFAQLAQRKTLKDRLEEDSFSGGSINDAMDQAWSEYNHHWAGIIVFAAGFFAGIALLLQRRWPRNWFRHWPLLFLGLAVFIVLRADADAWPLGPRSFWGSFAEAEVLEHRIFAVLIAAFAFFEWAVETGRWRSQVAAMVFPAICALGGALLMTHSHSLGALKEETLTEMSHSPIAMLGATAGWSRWLELRLPEEGTSRLRSALSWLWPVCFMLVGLVLLNYRES